MLNVALVSIGRGPTLALRNLCTYARADKNLDREVRFHIFQYRIDSFHLAAKSNPFTFITPNDHVMQDLQRISPRIIGLSCYIWNIEYMLKLAQDIKQLFPDVCLILGGPNASPIAAEILNEHPGVDIIVKGDGEIPFTALLNELVSKKEPDFGAIEGLVFRNGSEVIENAPCSEDVDLSRLEGVYDDLPQNFNLQKWLNKRLLYETERGCPYDCSFCTWGNRKIISKDVDLVINELLYLLKKGVDVWIVDPTFTAHKRRSKKILKSLAQHTYSGTLILEAHKDSVDEEFVRLFTRTNVSEISLGLQTISKSGLQAANRSTDLEKFQRAVKLLQKYKVNFRVDVIYGLPQTTPEDFIATFDFLHPLGLHYRNLAFYRLLGLPGSPLVKDAQQYGMKFSKSPPYELLSSNSYTLKDLMFCRDFCDMYHKLLLHLYPDGLYRFVKPTDSVATFVKMLVEFDRTNPLARMGLKPFRSHSSLNADEQVQHDQNCDPIDNMDGSLMAEGIYAPN